MLRLQFGCLLVVTLCNAMSVSELRAADPLPKVTVLETADKVRFAVLGDKPAEPAPTLIVLSGGGDETLTSAYFLQGGVPLLKQGYLCVSLDLPCHGQDIKAGEPAGIAGWRHRLEAGQDLMADLNRRTKAMLDYLVENKYTNVDKIAVTGTSRGGFSALHVAASDPRIRCVAAMAPVTDLFVVTEFMGMKHPERAAALSVSNLANDLAARNVWLVIGDRDARVGTDNMIAFGRKLSAVAIEKKLNTSIEIHVLAEPQGHTTPKGAAEQSAAWIAELLKTGTK